MTVFRDTGDRVVVRDSENDRDKLVVIVNEDCLEVSRKTAKNVYEGLREALIHHGELSRGDP